MMKQLLLLLISMCMVAGIYAQPTISNVSGTVSHGQSITLSGSGFGTKSQATPLIWDDLSSSAYSALSNGDPVPTQQGEYGSPLDVGAPWSSQGNPWSNPVIYNTTDTRVVGKPCYRVDNKGFLEGEDPGGSEIPKMYVTWWVNFSHDINNGPNGSASTKLIRVWDSSGDNGRVSWTGKHMTYEGSATASWADWGGTYGQWNRVEIFIDNEAHTIKAYTNGQLKHNVTNLGTTPSNYLNWIALIGIDPSIPSNLDPNLTADFGDIYADTEFARIELGNASTWTSCTHKEIQIPSAWSSGSVTVTVNKGTFTGGQTAYLYVMDANGNVNSTGYPVTINGSSGTIHSITASAGTGGSITPNGTVQVAEGDSLNFSITADSGYEISEVTVDGVGQGAVSSYTFTNVQANHTISASFAAVGSDIIVDNGGTGTSQSGSWSSSSHFPGYYGSSYMYAPNASGHWYEWSASLAAGTYEVYAWWSAAAGRPADAAYDITHSGGTVSVTADQTTNGGQWNLLGTYTFGATGAVRLNSSANGPEGACADAVKFVEVPTYTITASAGTGGSIGPDGSVQVIQGANQSFTITADSGYQISDVAIDGVGQGAVSSYTFTDVQANHTISASFAAISSDIIIDNGGTGTAQSGSWSSSSYFPGYYGSSYMYAPNASGHWYEWSASLAAGTYEVYAWWSAATGRPADVVYDIAHSGGTANVTADQTTNGGQWNLLGTYAFGTTGVVRLNSSANGPEGACADAVKFVEAPTIENLALNKSVAVSGEPEPANPGTSAVDGIVTTRWSASGGYPQWLEVDLGDIYNINATEVVCYQDRAYQFTIEAKTTIGGGYSQIVDRSANTQGGSEASPIRDDFTEVAARYVRINVTGANVYSGTWVSLLEFRVFGIAVPVEGGRILNNKQLLQQVEAGKESGIEVYPNPSSTTLTIAVNSEWEGLSKVEVYNTQGQQVHRELGVSFPHQVDISSYQEGIYLIKITNGTHGIVKRIIKE